MAPNSPRLSALFLATPLMVSSPIIPEAIIDDADSGASLRLSASQKGDSLTRPAIV
jgi:hypothetical protein